MTIQRLLLGLILVGLLSCTGKKQESQDLHLAIWANYIPQNILDRFSQETGTAVKLSYYSSNEELLAKVQNGASGLDMGVPSDYMVDIMVKQNLASEIDKSQIKFLQQINPQLLNQSFDPRNQYSLPFSWTVTGIAINRDLYKGTIRTWKDLFSKDDLKGKLALLDDVREVLGAALIASGQNVNSTDPKQIQQARDIVAKAKARVKMFSSDSVEILKGKEVAVAQSYSVDALQARKQSQSNIEFLVPEDGSTRAIDNFLIFKEAKNKKAALQFINFILQPEIHRQITAATYSGSVFERAESEGLKLESIKNLQKIQDLGASVNELYEAAWTKIKSGDN